MAVLDIFKGKSWNALTQKERAIFKKNKTLEDAALYAHEGSYTPNLVSYYLDKTHPPMKMVFSALIELAKSSSAQQSFSLLQDYCLQRPALLEQWKSEDTCSLFSALQQSSWETGLAFYDKLPQGVKVDRYAPLHGLVRNSSNLLLDYLQNRVPAEDTDLLAYALQYTGKSLNQRAFLDIVSVVGRRPDGQELLTNALVVLVKSSSSFASVNVDALLDMVPALDVNMDDGALIREAAQNRSTAMLRVLSKHGARVAEQAPALYDGLIRKWGVSDDTAVYLSGFLPSGLKKSQKKTEEVAVQQEVAPSAPCRDDYTLSGTDTLVQVKPLLPRGTLTTMFNFALCQQTVVADTGAGVTMTTVPFSAIEGDLGVLAEKFVSLGGEAGLAEMPVAIIKKPRLTPDGGK